MSDSTTTSGTVTTTVNYRCLSDGSPEGVQVQHAVDSSGNPAKMSVYGGVPVPQPTGPGQAALTRGLACGSVVTIQSQTISASAVGTLTTAEQGLTLMASTTASFQVASGDVLYVNKPTAQAGLGVGNVRVSATNVVGVTLSNFTTATITPTTNQSWGILALRGFPTLSGTFSPAAVPPHTIAEQQFPLTGLRTSLVQVMKPTAQTGLDIVGCRAVSANLLGITFANPTAATITPTAAEVYTVFEAAGLDAVGNYMVVQENFVLSASSNTVNAASQGATMTGLQTTDTVLGISKPTAQSNFGIGGFFVSAAGTLGITILNFAAATVTPTATDVYEVGLFRPNPVAPLVVSSVLLTPSSVAANTTAEQGFAVPGVVASSLVWVNKPSATPGLGISGVRVSSAGTIGITFCNSTSSSITPPAETYLVGNFQLALGDANSEWIQTANPTSQQQSILANSLRAAMTSTNLIAGA